MTITKPPMWGRRQEDREGFQDEGHSVRPQEKMCASILHRNWTISLETEL